MSDSAIYREYTKAREGGISKDKFDSAAKFPVPDGTGNHSCNGITWKTFVYLSHILGYEATPANFYSMADKNSESGAALFGKIYNHFWEDAGANLVISQAISHYVFQGLWGGGYQTMISDIQKFFKGAVKITCDMDEATAAKVNVFCGSKANELAFMLYCHKKRLLYLRGCRTYNKHKKGWEDRMARLQIFNTELINEKPNP